MITFLQDFFEEMDEMVYISDPESYEILSMNRRLRESLGYNSNEECRGKKCYEVLQGLHRPCAFCTNGRLVPGQHVSWMHRNPMLNKNFLIKDTLVQIMDKSYRVEVALDIDAETISRTPHYYARSESLLNECLQQVFASTDPGDSIQSILSFIGQTFLCDRAYVFEVQGNIARNTYEWCRPGVIPQKDILQQVSLADIQCWLDLFQKKKLVVIRDLEAIRLIHPTVYAILKAQDVCCLTVAPIIVEQELIGFVGVDNPSQETIDVVGPLIKTVCYFVLSLLRRRDLLKRLNRLSFRDNLTGAFNRNALFDRYSGIWPGSSMGVIFCDVTGLKQTNDTMGHDAGDELLRHCYKLIAGALKTDLIFRAGGDEFVVVYENIQEECFLRQVQLLRQTVEQDGHHVAMGFAWSGRPPIKFEEIISQADASMYQDKRSYYEAACRFPDQGLRVPCQSAGSAQAESKFSQFIHSTYCDMELFFTAVSQQNTTSYFYFGDMQKDMFYISDNMRDEFGFEGNIVPGLLREWAKRIPIQRAQEKYKQELISMLQEKRCVHDMRYQVRTVDGRTIWIRCYGVLKWNEDQTIPLFFSGRVTHQDEDFVVDPVTNFPREGALLRRLDALRDTGTPTLAIGFSLNRIRDLNNTRGRAYTDKLIRKIAEELAEQMPDKTCLYRLEGMRCLALVDCSCPEEEKELVGRIRDIIDNRYRTTGISVQRSSSFALMRYPQAKVLPADFLEQMGALIRSAKQEPALPYAEYSDALPERSRRMANMALALSHDVLHGMEHFRVVVQPVVDSDNGKVQGGEALLRWSFEGKDIPPSIFIPLLEENEMIHTAGRWIFEQALVTCLRVKSYDPDFYLTFNVSLQQMTDEGFSDFIEQTLQKYGADGSCIVAEVTESCLDEQPEKLLRFVRNCEKNGIRIALDDFGNGYSSFRRLLRYPSSIVKLDRTLLREMTESDEKMNFISSIVYACHRFGKKVCMEGVETAEQNQLIRETGCDMIQGYYYHRPMELKQLYHLLAVRSKKAEDFAGPAQPS